MRKVLVTFYTEIGRGSLKMEKNAEMCAKSKKSKKNVFCSEFFPLSEKNSFAQFDIFFGVEFEIGCLCLASSSGKDFYAFLR